MIHLASRPACVARLCCALLLATACATPTSTSTPSAASADVDPADALAALWAAPAFELDAATLARASGGPVPRRYDTETLLEETSFTLDDAGRAVEVWRVVRRIVSREANQTVSLQWSPWRQERPVVRARVVSPDGVEHRLDPATIVVGSVAMDDVELSDVQALRVPLPQVSDGAVVELEVTVRDTRPLLEGGGRTWSTALWSFAPRRRVRHRLDVPAGVDVRFDAVGVAAPAPVVEGGRRVFALDVGELTYLPMARTLDEQRASAPRFGWSTAPSWAEVARRYGRVIQPVLDEQVALPITIPPTASTKEKAQAVLRFVADNLRYTAIHLGDGAIVPTRPGAVLKRGYGDCKDLSVLVVGALRRLGVDADVALTAIDGDDAHERLPGLEAFNHMVVVVNDGTGRLWIDPTAPDFPVGILPAAARDQQALIIDAATAGLTAMPTGDDTTAAYQTLFDLRFAPFGVGAATVTLTAASAAEGVFRSSLRRCDEKAARNLLAPDFGLLFVEPMPTPTLSGCRPGDGPIVASASLPVAGAVDTGDMSASITLPGLVIDDIIPQRVRGEEPGSDQRSPEAREADRVELLEQTGLTFSQLDELAWTFDSREASERTFRLHLPPHFSVATLPTTSTVALGPATVTRTATRVDERTLEVSFRASIGKTRWTVDDVRAFRAAYWPHVREPAVVVTATFEPQRLYTEGRADDAMAQWRKLAAADPRSRARLGHQLLRLGFGELAVAELAQAREAMPDDALVLLVSADLARRDAVGELYRPPFDRAGAIAFFREGLAAAADHQWGVLGLAETLRRNAAGEFENRWSDDMAEAARRLEQLHERGRGSDATQAVLQDIYARGGRTADFVRAIDPARAADGLSPAPLLFEILTRGPEAAMSGLMSAIAGPGGQEVLGTTMMRLVQLDELDTTSRLLSAMGALPGLVGARPMIETFNASLRPAPIATTPPTDPEAAARRLFAEGAAATSSTDFVARLLPLASTAGRAELLASLEARRIPGADARLDWLVLFHQGVCTTTSVGRLARVSCSQPRSATGGDGNSTTYWVNTGGTFSLESRGVTRHMAERALNAVDRKDLVEAAAWMDWLLEEFPKGKATPARARTLQGLWKQTGRSNVDAVRFAATFARTITVVEVTPDLIAGLEAGRGRLSGPMRRRVDIVIAEAHADAGNLTRAIALLRGILAEDPDAWVERRLATFESKAGLNREATARITRALKDAPDDAGWHTTKGLHLLRSGRAADAVAVFEQAPPSDENTNNLLWARLIAGAIDDDDVQLASRMVAPTDAPSERLHTAALVLLERGLVRDAAAMSNRRPVERRDGTSDADLLLRGRLLQKLGFVDEALATYGRMKRRDPDVTPLVARFTSEVRR